MHIISLTELQFKNYSRIHSKRNYLQSIEFANMQKNNGYSILYVGMIDDENNLVAASLILGKKIIGKYFLGHAPGGYLIDYNNYDLLSKFTKLLKEYLSKLNYVYISINPLYPIKISNKKKDIIYNNSNIINNLNTLGYKKCKRNTLNTILYLQTNGNIQETYNNLSRFVKRNIQENKLKSIKIYEGEKNDIDTFYKFINKKTNFSKEYYNELFTYFNNDNNKFEIYFAFLDTNEYLKNYNNLLNKEKRNNEKISEKILNINIKNKRDYVDKKINSDKLLEKYNNEIKKAINLNNLYKNGLIAATVAIIKTNNEITFLIDGYEEKIRNIRASYTIKWEIIKKYSELGYTTFNLGYIPNSNNKKIDGIVLSRIGFNANIHETPGNYNLIINNSIYTLINFMDNSIPK